MDGGDNLSLTDRAKLRALKAQTAGHQDDDPWGVLAAYRQRQQRKLDPGPRYDAIILVTLFGVVIAAFFVLVGPGTWIREVPVPVSLGRTISATRGWTNTGIELGDRAYRVVVTGRIKDGDRIAPPEGLSHDVLPDSYFKIDLIPAGNGLFRKQKVFNGYRLEVNDAPYLGVLAAVQHIVQGKGLFEGTVPEYKIRPFYIGAGAELPVTKGTLLLGINDFVTNDLGMRSGFSSSNNEGAFDYRLEPVK